MIDLIVYKTNNASVSEILNFLIQCDEDFIPPLSSRVTLNHYADKIAQKSKRFEAWHEDQLIGLVAMYCNDSENSKAFITNVSVQSAFARRGVAKKLLQQCIEHAKLNEIQQICLEVGSDNLSARRLYDRLGFNVSGVSTNMVEMIIFLKESNHMNKVRNYDVEGRDTKDHKYAYSFDFDVMHPFMVRSFRPFFIKGNLLELGSFRGDFTKRFVELFDDITCVEASDEALQEAEKRLGNRASFIKALFEEVELPRRYDNIIMTHVLEHIDDPVRVLKRVNDEWLTEGGRFFLVCPNANAPSRQIAVKMGLIAHNSAVTQAESEHGHLRTYTIDTLERDAVAAGLKVVYRSGVFFKALANFQWDQLLQTDIISNDYLEGCFALGQQYPDLCSSIFLLCEKGESK